MSLFFSDFPLMFPFFLLDFFLFSAVLPWFSQFSLFFSVPMTGALGGPCAEEADGDIRRGSAEMGFFRGPLERES